MTAYSIIYKLLTYRAQAWVWLVVIAIAFGALGYWLTDKPAGLDASLALVKIEAAEQREVLASQQAQELMSIDRDYSERIEEAGREADSVRRKLDADKTKRVDAASESDKALQSQLRSIVGEKQGIEINGDVVTMPRKTAVAIVAAFIDSDNRLKLERAKLPGRILADTRSVVIEQTRMRHAADQEALKWKQRYNAAMVEVEHYKAADKKSKMEKIYIAIGCTIGAVAVTSAGFAIADRVR